MVELRESTPTEQKTITKPETPILEQDGSKSRINSLKHILEKLRHKTPRPEISPTPNPDFLIPIMDITYKEFNKKHPESSEQMQIVLKEVQGLAIKNFTVHESIIYPGVSFSYTKLPVNADLIQKIAPIDKSQSPEPETPEDTNQENSAEAKPPKDRVIFLFVPFAPPPDGSGLSPLDMGIDRVMRNIPRVAHALKNGETPPNIDIYCIGTPIGFAGKSTEEYRDAIIKDGLAANGKMYGAFMNEKLKGMDPENTYVLAQGASMGAINADQAVMYLSPEFKKHTQILLDVPAGHHEPITPPWTQKPTIVNPRGIQTASMLGAETTFRMLTDPKMKDQGERAKRLYEYLSKEKNIAPDNSSQTKLKLRCLYETGLKLVKGSPLNTDVNRTYIRSGTFDPLSTGPLRIGERVASNALNKAKKYLGLGEIKGITSVKKKGRSLEFPYNTSHFWAYTRRFNRWEQAFKYCKGLSQPKT